MRVNFICVIRILIIFLSLSFNFFADEGENVGKIFNQIVERAELFGDIFEKGDPDDLAKMFKSYPHAPIIVIYVIKDEPGPLIKDVQDYYFYVSNVNANIKFSWADFTNIRYFKNVKESDNSEHLIAYIIDIGRTIDNIQSEVFFNKEKMPTECSIVYNVFHEVGEKQIASRVKWDEKRNIVTKKEWNLVTERKITAPPIPHAVQDKLAKNEVNNQTKTFFSFKPVTLPKTNDKKVEAVLRRIEYIANMKRPDDFAQLHKWERIKESYNGAIQCVNGKIRDIIFTAPYNYSGFIFDNGYYVSIDDNGKISAYAEGINDSLEERTFENFYNNQGKTRNYYWIRRNLFGTIKKGVEVTFHSNGYPSTYHTIVRDRLFGRQIEWNDKGGVLSDVDLDIPKTWADAPKKSEKDK